MSHVLVNLLFKSNLSVELCFPCPWKYNNKVEASLVLKLFIINNTLLSCSLCVPYLVALSFLYLGGEGGWEFGSLPATGQHALKSLPCLT